MGTRNTRLLSLCPASLASKSRADFVNESHPLHYWSSLEILAILTQVIFLQSRGEKLFSTTAATPQRRLGKWIFFLLMHAREAMVGSTGRSARHQSGCCRYIKLSVLSSQRQIKFNGGVAEWVSFLCFGLCVGQHFKNPIACSMPYRAVSETVLHFYQPQMQ